MGESEDTERAREDEEEAREESEEAEADPNIILEIPDGPDEVIHNRAIKQQRETWEEDNALEVGECDGDDEAKVSDEFQVVGDDEPILDKDIVSDKARLI